MKLTFQCQNDTHLTECGEETKTNLSYAVDVEDGMLPAVFEHFENFLRSCGYVIPSSTRIQLVSE